MTTNAAPDVEPSEAPPRAAGVPMLVVVAIALVAGLVGFTIGSSTAGTGLEPALADEAAPDAGADTVSADPDARPTLGAADAPVVMEIYSDFACPFCVRHDTEVEPELVSQYVDTGQVRLVWYDTPFQGPPAQQMAVAARAAQRQGGFWAMKEALFRSGGVTDPAQLQTLAESIGLDGERFAADLADPALATLVQQDLNRSQQLGVRGTPTFLIGEERIIGAQPLNVFVDAIDRALASA